MRLSLIFTILFLFIGSAISAQTVISGKLLDENQKPIPNISVSYKKIGATAILGFSRSTEDGRYNLTIKVNELDSLQVEFSHMSYAKHTVVVPNKTSQYSYILQSQVQKIKEVKIGDMPIYRKKDTLNYSVSAFTSKQDRMISDIIRKLPGIEIHGDEILYQGKPIQKYMVNNLDLMEGRYQMINKNLSADAVRSVQMIENDQPIKILDSVIFSDRASLNLELKKFTSTGTGKVGLGASPALWDVNLTPMTFGKTFQMLNSLQTNNIGYDATKDLRSFYSGGRYSNQTLLEEGPSYIALRNIISPGFSENKWLDNKLFLLSSNILQKLNNEIQLKANISYYDDTRKSSGFTATQYFPADEIIYNTEDIDNHFRINVLDAAVLLEKNEKQIYFRNGLRFHKRWDSDQGNLLFNNDNQIKQHRAYTDEVLQNAFALTRLVGKQYVHIQSTIDWRQTPQALAVMPGQFENILNDGLPFNEMSQQVLFKSFRWNNKMSFIKTYGNWGLSPLIGINFERNNLDSEIEIRTAENKHRLGEGYVNDVDNSQLNLSLGLGISWQTKVWKLNLSTPYNLYYYNVSQQGIKTLDNTIRQTFNPTLSATYIVNSNNDLSANIAVGRNYGGLDNFYNGYIISQYRSMQRYTARLLQNDNRSAGINYNYKNPLKANFANFSYHYSQDERDYIFDSRIDSLGRMNMSITDQNSKTRSHNLTGGISRFFSSLQTIAKLNANLRWSYSDYLLNGTLAGQHSHYRGTGLEIINTSSKIFSAEYKTTIGQTKSKFASDRKTNIISNNHFLNLVFYLVDEHAISINNSLYGNNYPGQETQFFIDAKYSYSIKKWKMDLELIANNILNNNQYLQQIYTDYQLVQSYFELRPRQFILSSKFKF